MRLINAGSIILLGLLSLLSCSGRGKTEPVYALFCAYERAYSSKFQYEYILKEERESDKTWTDRILEENGSQLDYYLGLARGKYDIPDIHLSSYNNTLAAFKVLSEIASGDELHRDHTYSFARIQELCIQSQV